MTDIAETLAASLASAVLRGASSVEAVADQLESLDAAGYQIVPKEPTESMIKAGDDAASDALETTGDSGGESWQFFPDGASAKVHRAMLAAAPKP